MDTRRSSLDSLDRSLSSNSLASSSDNRLSSDGSVNSELSSNSSGSSEVGRSWASPAQLNGLSLNLQLPPRLQPQSPSPPPTQLNAPPPRRIDASQLQGQSLTQQLSQELGEVLTEAAQTRPTQDFSLFSSQPLTSSTSLSPQALPSPPPPPPQEPQPHLQSSSPFQYPYQNSHSMARSKSSGSSSMTASGGPVLNEVRACFACLCECVQAPGCSAHTRNPSAFVHVQATTAVRVILQLAQDLAPSSRLQQSPECLDNYNSHAGGVRGADAGLRACGQMAGSSGRAAASRVSGPRAQHCHA